MSHDLVLHLTGTSLPSINDPHGICHVLVTSDLNSRQGRTAEYLIRILLQPFADLHMHALGQVRRRSLASPNGPHWLVRDDHPGPVVYARCDVPLS